MMEPTSPTPDIAELSPAVPDMAERSPALARVDRTRYQLSLSQVAQRFIDAGVPRSEKTLRRYCTAGKLDAVQSDGPTSREQWYVREASVDPLIGELLQIHGGTLVAGHGAAQPDNVQHDREDAHEIRPHTEPVAAEPSSAVPNHAGQSPDRGATTPSYDRLDLSIYDHPYVKKLEDRIDRLETRYEAQVRRTEEIQLKSQERLVELQRMTTIGQSKTLADFMLQAKNWLIGGESTDAEGAGDQAAIS